MNDPMFWIFSLHEIQLFEYSSAAAEQIEKKKIRWTKP